MANQTGLAFLDDSRSWREEVKRELHEQNAKLAEQEATIKTLQSSNQLFQNTSILIRKGVFENVLLREQGRRNRNTIEARNHAAHGGDVLLDSRMLDMIDEGAEGEILAGYRKVSEDLYGVSQSQLRTMEQHPDMVRALNHRASAWLSDRFWKEREYEVRKMADKIAGAFLELDLSKAIEELKDGELSQCVSELDRAYHRRG